MSLQLKDPSLLKSAAYIGGAWVEGADTFAVKDPATDVELARVANLDRRHAEQAIVAANAA